MQSSGEMPELDRSDSLTGPDTDNNGIRDDIDRYLLTVEASEAEKLALVQVARALQAVQASDLSSENKLRELDDVTLKASACVMDTYERAVDADRESRKLQGYTANTRNRTRHYIKYNQLRDGTIFKLPKIGVSCDGVAQ